MEKPKINPSLGNIDFLFEALSAIAIIYMVAQLIMEYPGLAEKVPTHFGADGSPDDWGNKSSLLILPVLTIVLYVGMTLINFYPHIFNYPVKITEQNTLKQYQLAKSLICTLKFTTISIFLYIQLQTISVAKELHNGLGGYFIFVVLIGSFLPIVIYFFLATKNK